VIDGHVTALGAKEFSISGDQTAADNTGSNRVCKTLLELTPMAVTKRSTEWIKAGTRLADDDDWCEYAAARPGPRRSCSRPTLPMGTNDKTSGRNQDEQEVHAAR
jgi:hypothetical protein